MGARAAIARLYEGLVVLAPTLGAHVARAAAVGAWKGPRAGLDLLDAMPADRIAAFQSC